MTVIRLYSISTVILQVMNIELLKTAISQYNIGSLTELPVVFKGDVDINHKIVTDKGVYLLKYIVNKKNLPQFECLGELHEYLRNKDIPFPKIYKTQSDKYVENDFILYEFIEGEIKNDWSEKELISLTQNFANMLLVLKDYPVPNFIKNKDDKYTRGYNIEYCHNVLRPKILNLSLSANTKNSILDTVDTMFNKLSEFESLPKYLVHGDLNEMNAIFKNNKNVGIIDFGGSYDPLVYDLGEFMYWFTMPVWSKNFNHVTYRLIKNTFQMILPLSSKEDQLLPYMILRRGMMDIMLTLNYYWENEQDALIPESRLELLTIRNNKILDLIKLSKIPE